MQGGRAGPGRNVYLSWKEEEGTNTVHHMGELQANIIYYRLEPGRAWAADYLLVASQQSSTT